MRFRPVGWYRTNGVLHVGEAPPRRGDRRRRGVAVAAGGSATGLCQGYEDRNDITIPGATIWPYRPPVSGFRQGASSPSWCRWENRMGRSAAWAIHEEFLNQFIGSFQTSPAELMLDFDVADEPVYGAREGRFSMAHDRYRFLPRYIFRGENLLAAGSPGPVVVPGTGFPSRPARSTPLRRAT